MRICLLLFTMPSQSVKKYKLRRLTQGITAIKTLYRENWHQRFIRMEEELQSIMRQMWAHRASPFHVALVNVMRNLAEKNHLSLPSERCCPARSPVGSTKSATSRPGGRPGWACWKAWAILFLTPRAEMAPKVPFPSAPAALPPAVMELIPVLSRLLGGDKSIPLVMLLPITDADTDDGIEPILADCSFPG